MHLDLSPMLPSQVIQDIEEVVAQFGHCCPNMMWPLWLRNVDINTTSINILQSAAQVFSSYGSVIATLRFGLYCSRYFFGHGKVLSDEVALYYLRSAFYNLSESEQQRPLLEWIQKAEGFEFSKGERHQFWIQACATYAHHEYDENPDRMDRAITFAFEHLIRRE